MKKIDNYIDRAKEKLNIKSDSELSLYFGLSRGAVNNWRMTRSCPDEYSEFLIAEIIGEEEKKVVANIRAEYEKDTMRKEFWQEKVKEYGFIDRAMNFSILLLMMISACVFYVVVNNNYFSTQKTASFNNNIHYAHNNISRKRRYYP